MNLSLEQAVKSAFIYSNSISNRKLGADYYNDAYDWFKTNLNGTATEYESWIELVHVFTTNTNQLAISECYMNYQQPPRL